MKALVVYESLYGNTAAIGEAIAGGFRARGLDVEVGPVTRIEPASTATADLVVIGGPTHAHGMSRTTTRKTGANDEKNPYAAPTLEPGLREWLEILPAGGGRLAAAFDTRFDKPAFLTGSAAKGIAKRLERHGFRLAAPPQSFFVMSDNTLADGQEEHAFAWASATASRTTVAHTLH
jgi:hypothetical protein